VNPKHTVSFLRMTPFSTTMVLSPLVTRLGNLSSTTVKHYHVTYVKILTRVECMYLSNTTLFSSRDIYSIYYIRYNYMFWRLYSAHLQVVHEILSKQLYETYIGCIQWGGRSRGGHEISCHRGCMGWIHGDSAIIRYAMSKLN